MERTLVKFAVAIALAWSASACAQMSIGVVGGTPAPSSNPAPTLVQQTASVCQWSSGSNYTCVLPSTPSISNVLVLGIAAFQASGTVTHSVSSSGATWASLGRNAGTTNIAEEWCATLSGSPGSTITINISGGTLTNERASASEWSGTTCNTDAAAAGSSGSSSTATTASLTTSNAYDLMLATAMIAFSGGSSPSTINAPYNALSGSCIGGASVASWCFAYLVTTTTGSYAATWNFSPGTAAWRTIAASLKNH